MLDEDSLMKQAVDARVRWESARREKTNPDALALLGEELKVRYQTEYVFERTKSLYDLYLSAIGVPRLRKARQSTRRAWRDRSKWSQIVQRCEGDERNITRLS